MTRRCSTALVLSTFLHAPALAQPPATQPPSPAELAPVDVAAGWKLLFDGRTTTGWRAYRGQAFPQTGWTVTDACLKCAAGGGDIVTIDQYGDFELVLEWKIAPRGNSGIMYRVSESQEAPWMTGPEFQILDDPGTGTKPATTESAGAVFDLYAPGPDKLLKPADEFNQTRIRLSDNVLQHWVNGTKVVECTLGSDDWKERVARSKFKGFAGFGTQPRGHIALQDHGNAVAFRNIKIRDLSAPLPKEVRLFSGRDLAGWTACLPEGTTKEDVWSVQDAILICKGQPNGYLRTEADYKNYVLKLEWRFSPVTKKPGNSGVLLRMIGPDKVWPKSVEAQLQSENAGDFWDIDEFPMKADPGRTQGRNTKKSHGAERPVGEWNEYEIIVDGPRVILKVNGEVLNEAWDVLETPGKIGLQSEGAEIHFRNIRLAPLD